MKTAAQIDQLSSLTAAAVNGGQSARIARTKLFLTFQELRDRLKAAELACVVLDDAKKSGKLGVRVTGTKKITIVSDGIESCSVKDVRNDTTSNGKLLLASCVNAAYKDYADKIILVSHKTAATTFKFAAVTPVDKLEQATKALLDLLNVTEAEEASFRVVVKRMHDSTIEAAETRKRDAEAARLQREAEEAELVALAMATRTQIVSDKLRAQGLEGAALEQAVQAVLAM